MPGSTTAPRQQLNCANKDSEHTLAIQGQQSSLSAHSSIVLCCKVVRYQLYDCSYSPAGVRKCLTSDFLVGVALRIFAFRSMHVEISLDTRLGVVG